MGNSPINGFDPLGLSYWGDVGAVFGGYGRALGGIIPGIISTGDTLINQGPAAAIHQMANGLVGMVNGLGSDDPGQFGQSLGGVLIAAASEGG